MYVIKASKIIYNYRCVMNYRKKVRGKNVLSIKVQSKKILSLKKSRVVKFMVKIMIYIIIIFRKMYIKKKINNYNYQIIVKQKNRINYLYKNNII